MTLIWDYTLNWIKRKYYLFTKSSVFLVIPVQLVTSRNITFFYYNWVIIVQVIEKTAWMLNCKDDAKTACLI